MRTFALACSFVFSFLSISCADISSRLNIATQDGTTCNTFPYKVIYANSACTDNGNGTVSISGGGSSVSGSPTGIFFASDTSTAAVDVAHINYTSSTQTQSIYNVQVDPVVVGTFFPNYEVKKKSGNTGCIFWDDDSGSTNGFYGCMKSTDYAMGAVTGIAGATSLLPFMTFDQGGSYPTNSTMTIIVPFVLSGLSASLPLQTDANKKVVSSAIDLSGSQATGTMAAGRFPALTGDVTNSAGSLTTTAAATQPNIVTFAASSITVAGTNGLVVNFGSSLSTASFRNSTSANTITISTSATGINLVSISSTVATKPNDFVLIVASPTQASPTILGVTLSGHLVSSGTAPSPGACGTTPAVSAGSTDLWGSVSWSGAATTCVLNFANPHAAGPFCIADSAGAAFVEAPVATATSITFTLSTSLTASTITWHCPDGGAGF